MRAAGLKVTLLFHCDGITPQINIQKIDKLKGQLMAMADLMKPGLRGAAIGVEATDELDEEELAVLIDAGIISRNPKSRRRRPNHILFVEDERAVHRRIAWHIDLSASSRITILCRPGGRVTFFCANALILPRTTSMPL